MTAPRKADWEAIGREYRAGQLSVREIARLHGLTEGAIRKRAKAEGWIRDLADQVRAAVRVKLVRTDGTQDGTRDGTHSRSTERAIVESASLRGFEVVTSHRRDLTQLHGLKRVLATRLAAVLNGEEIEGPCLGAKESPGDLLAKLSQVAARLIPLERQAYSLDAEPEDARAATPTRIELVALVGQQDDGADGTD